MTERAMETRTETEPRGGEQGGAAASAAIIDKPGGWLRGAALLGGAALVSKAIGTLQKIPLQNIAGDRVFGLYSAVYPFYQLLLFLAAAGVPVALSMLVAERRRGGEEGGWPLIRMAMLLMGATGAVGFAAMWLGAETFAAWIGDGEAAQAIRMSALALWCMPALAALRGYFQGLEQMGPSAASQVAEQAVRVAAMLALLAVGWQLGWGDGALAAGATAGSAFGGAAGLAVMLRAWQLHRRGQQPQPRERGGTKRRPAPLRLADARLLAAVGLPAALASLAVPLAGIVDAFTVPGLLAAEGLAPPEAMALFGLYSRGQPLTALVVMTAGAIAGAMVPAIAAARSRDRDGAADAGMQAAARQAASAVRFAWPLGLAASVGLVLLAEPINVMLYADAAATKTLAIVVSAAWAGTISAVAAAALQGLGRVRLPAALLLLSALMKAALNAALVPALGIEGAAWAGAASLAAAALLGAAAVRRAAGIASPPRAGAAAAGTAAALACMAAALLLTERGLSALLGPGLLPPRAAATLLALTGTAVGAAVFAAALLRFGGVRAEELGALPGGGKLAAKLRQLRLLP